MRFLHSRLFPSLLGFAAVASGINPAVNAAGPLPPSASDHARIVAHWTPERVAAAIPRDLVIDERGQGYLRKPDGSLEPYGRTVAAMAMGMEPNAKPIGGTDTEAPQVSNRDPVVNKIIGASYVFKATVTDNRSVRAVTFRVGMDGRTPQSFRATLTSNNVWEVSLTGFIDGNWQWSVLATDKAGNQNVPITTSFTVATGGGGDGGSDVVSNAEWMASGLVQSAAGRLYFEMPGNRRWTSWVGYVCSGTVVTDETGDRSIIQTAAHCVYDDVYKAFARNVMFIPNQADTSGSGTDGDCENDPLGCWTPTYGVVDINWTSREFPDNIGWDYGYYVVSNTDNHRAGFLPEVSDTLDDAAGSLPISFKLPQFQVSNSDVDYTHALGYSYSVDPKFMYCAEDLVSLGDDNWWLSHCALSGGSSGGPWVQPMEAGSGPLISVNSWGYTNQPGMAGPRLFGTSAQCVFAMAKGPLVPASTLYGRAGLIYSGTCGN